MKITSTVPTYCRLPRWGINSLDPRVTYVLIRAVYIYTVLLRAVHAKPMNGLKLDEDFPYTFFVYLVT